MWNAHVLKGGPRVGSNIRHKVAFSMDGSLLIVGSQNGINIWEAAGIQNQNPLHSAVVETLLCIAVSPKGLTFASCKWIALRDFKHD